MKYIAYLLLSLLLVSCATSSNIPRSSLSNPESFQGKTGIIAALETSYGNSNNCASQQGVIELKIGTETKTIDFYPNQIFAAALPPGKYRVTHIGYVCTTYYGNTREDKGFHTDMSNETYFNIPKNGFCKTFISTRGNSINVGRNDSELNHYAQNIPGFLGDTKRLGISLDGMPYCNLVGDEDFYKTMPQKESAGREMYDDFEGKVRLKWETLSDSSRGGNSTAKNGLAKSAAGNRSMVLDYQLKGGADAPSADLIALSDEIISMESCRAMAFDYKGEAVSFSLATYENQEMTLSKAIRLPATKEWRTVVIPKKDLVSSKEGGRLRFDQVVGFSWGATGYPGDKGKVFVDNVRCE